MIQTQERKEYILRQLEEKSSVTVTELSEALALSEVSIRKLLMSMEREGTLKRTWGGAVCTNAINIAMELAKAGDIHSIVIGGELRGNILSCVGGLAEWSLQRLFFDKGFVSGNHFTAEHGFSAPIFSEAELKRRVLSVSKEKFILMDYSKYGDDSLVQVAPLQGVDTLITDWHAPQELVRDFGEKGVRVIRAGADEKKEN